MMTASPTEFRLKEQAAEHERAVDHEGRRINKASFDVDQAEIEATEMRAITKVKVNGLLQPVKETPD